MTDSFARKGFDGDLVDGKLREDAFARVLLEGRERWEHKRDFKAAETGNLAVEYETRQSAIDGAPSWPSGIAREDAPYWWVVEFAPERRLILPVHDMRNLARIAIRGERGGRAQWGGDHNRFHNALVPMWWLHSISPNEAAELGARRQAA